MAEFIEEAIVDLFAADAGIREKFVFGDPLSAPAIYWGIAPPIVENFQRFAVLARVSQDSDATNTGATGMEDCGFTIAVWSRQGMADAVRAANKFRDLLKSLCGDGRFTTGGIAVQGVFYNGQVDATVAAWDGGEMGLSGRAVRFRVVFEEDPV